MKIIRRDLRNGKIRMYIDTMDDLWYLKNVIEKLDMITMRDLRTKEDDTEKLRSGKSEKISMIISLAIENVEFHPFSSLLRLRGKIVEAPQDLGLHHTFTISPGSNLTIRKPEWKNYQLDLMKEAEKNSRRAKVLFVSMDDEEATIAVLRAYGIEKIANIKSSKHGKQYREKSDWKGTFFAEVLASIENIYEENMKIAVVGPGFVKNELAELITKKQGVIIEDTGNAGMSGVSEALKRGVVRRIETEIRVSEEYESMEKLLQTLSRDPELCALGRENVLRALEMGAAERILILENLLRENEDLLRKADNTACKKLVVSSEHEGGAILKNLGGMATFLRFRIQ